MKALLGVIIILAAAAAGLWLGTMGVFYLCLGLDKIFYPEASQTGGGFMAIGWLAWLVSIPGGLLGGCYYGYNYGYKKLVNSSTNTTEDTNHDA